MKTPARRFFSIFLAIIMALSTQIFCFCADVLAEAPIIYVSPDGNDTSGDGTSDAPFATLKKAFSKINSNLGATIVLMGDIKGVEQCIFRHQRPHGASYHHGQRSRKRLSV